MGPSTPVVRARGFSLLEVMVALMILSGSMLAISALQTTTITMNATVHRSTTASHLLHWAMVELDLEFQKEGFPSNSIEGRDCELPHEFSDYRCEYDLVLMDITPEQVSELSMASMGNLFGGNMENMNGIGEQLKNAASSGQPMDANLANIFMFAAPFFGPEGAYLMQMCPIQWESLLTALMGTQMFLPQVVQFAADRIRKLKVTISWKEGFRGQRTFVAETFVTSLPEEMIKAAEQAEELRNLQDTLVPPPPPPPPPIRDAGVGMTTRGLHGGFTMVEMMVAIALLAMMTVLIYVAMRINFRAREEAYRIQSVYHQADVSFNRMRRNLSMAFLSKHVDEEKTRETKFIGKGNSVLFSYLGHLRLEASSRESDQGVVEFFLGNDKQTSQKALFMREKAGIDDNPESGGKVVKLAERVRSLKFTYWDDKQEDWQGDWKAELEQGDEVAADRKVQAIKKSVEKLTGEEEQDEFRLPKAMRIEMTLEDDTGHEYPFATALMLPMTRAFDW